MSVKVRFAPSPTGKLHVGNVRAALLNWLWARKQGGVFLLRSDDTDQARSTKAYEEGIKADLAWLGLSHGEFARQSERFAEYDAAAKWLKDKGLLYPCYETAEELDRKRKLQRTRGLPPVYDRAALALSEEERANLEAEGRRAHWRLRLSQRPVSWRDLIRGEITVDTKAVSDPVLIREDGQYLYTLPSCVDDVDFGITHVIRGEDHVTNTATQVELFQHLLAFRGQGAVPAFAHHSLLVGADGQGLSKRLGSLSIEAMREAGFEPAALTSFLARLGTSDPIEPQADIMALVERFSFEKFGKAPARFDEEELGMLNTKILHALPWAQVADRLMPMGVNQALWEAVRGNIAKLADVKEWLEVIKGPIEPVIEDASYTDEAAALVPSSSSLDLQSWPALTSALKEQTGRKGKQLFMPLRLALTGRSHGPDMAVMYQMIGAEKAKARLQGERV